MALTRIDAQAGLFSRTDVSSSAGTRGIVAADLNGDGWLDLALANNDPDTVWYFDGVCCGRWAAGADGH